MSDKVKALEEEIARIKARVIKLEKINRNTPFVQNVKDKRQSRIIKVPGGKLIMNYVLGKDVLNCRRILQETREILKTNGKRTKGLYIDVNRCDEEIKIWSHSKLGLDVMQDKIEGYIVNGMGTYNLDIQGYGQSRIIKVPDGKEAINQVLGLDFKGALRIIKETSKILETKGEIYKNAVYIRYKKDKDEVKIWSRSKLGLDILQNKIENSIAMARSLSSRNVCVHNFYTTNYIKQSISSEETVSSSEETTSSSEESDEYYALPPGLFDDE